MDQNEIIFHIKEQEKNLRKAMIKLDVDFGDSEAKILAIKELLSEGDDKRLVSEKDKINHLLKLLNRLRFEAILIRMFAQDCMEQNEIIIDVLYSTNLTGRNIHPNIINLLKSVDLSRIEDEKLKLLTFQAIKQFENIYFL